jgi:hypothetical protein
MQYTLNIYLSGSFIIIIIIIIAIIIVSNIGS